MNKTAIAALIAALSAGPALAQETIGTPEDPNVVLEPQAETGDAEVIVVDPEVEAVEPEVEVVEDPEVVVTDVEVAAPMGGAYDPASMIAVDDITDGPIYSTGEAYDDAAWTASDPYAATRLGGEPAGVAGTTGTAVPGTAAYTPYAYDANYANIGEIEDVILDTNGQMVGIVAEVGGFLGLGSKDVFLPVDDVRLVATDDTQFAYVTRMTEEQLEELPAIEEGLFD